MINSLVLPYTNFKLGDTINPDEFNSNNSSIISKVNEIVNVINTGSPGGGGDGDDIFLPSYIKETYIDPVEIRSPNITGNSFIGGSGMVGFSSVGTTQSSVRFWAGSTSRETAPFRVTHSGEVVMTKATITGEFKTNSGSTETSSLENDSSVGGRLILKSTNGTDRVKLGDIPPGASNYGGALSLFSKNGNYRVSIGVAGISTYEEGVIILDGHDGSQNVRITSNNNGLNRGNIILSSNGDFGVMLEGNGSAVIKKNLILGGTSGNSNYPLWVNGNINIQGDIYVKGVKMQLTPA